MQDAENPCLKAEHNMKKLVDFKNRAVVRSVGIALAVAPLASQAAEGDAPINMAATGTTIAGYIAGAAGAGLAVMAALYGVRIIIRAFKSVR